MNDEWSRCPICFEDYSLTHRPTTFSCGHSTCIDHTIGSQRLHHCPICRHALRQGDEYHVSYNLEEAARLFQLIKNRIDWSTVKFPSALDVNDPKNGTSEMIHNDEVYARRLQAELNRERRNEAPQRIPTLPVEPTPGIRAGLAAVALNLPSGHAKNCGHRCDLVTTRQCCVCSDQRPHHPGRGYESYVDGRGITYQASRNEHYCPVCKARS